MKLNDFTVTVRFLANGVRHNGKRYDCAELERKAKAGDEESLLVIAQLVEMQSGVIEILKKEGGENE